MGRIALAGQKKFNKILYFGMWGSGKTTIIKALKRVYKGLREKDAFPLSAGVVVQPFDQAANLLDCFDGLFDLATGIGFLFLAGVEFTLDLVERRHEILVSDRESDAPSSHIERL